MLRKDIRTLGTSSSCGGFTLPLELNVLNLDLHSYTWSGGRRTQLICNNTERIKTYSKIISSLPNSFCTDTLRHTRLDTSVLAFPLEFLWSHHRAQCLQFGCFLTRPSALHFQQRPKKQQTKRTGEEAIMDTHMAHIVSDGRVYISDF